MKQTILYLLIASVLLASCRKDLLPIDKQAAPCKLQTDNPEGRSYTTDSLISFTCTSRHCGIIPLSINNYWVYQDSVFNDGVLVKVSTDTLRYTKTFKSLTDGLVWWQGNLSIGLPDLLYVNDSSIFEANQRLFAPDIRDAKKEYGLFQGDSVKYLTSFTDAAALGRSIKMETDINTPAGIFTGCVYFEKNARNYRKDQVYFKPGTGVIRYIQEKAPMGTRSIKLQQVSTLITWHIE